MKISNFSKFSRFRKPFRFFLWCFLLVFSVILFFVVLTTGAQKPSRDVLFVVDVGTDAELRSLRSIDLSVVKADRLGLVIFAQYPWFVVPFTQDYSGFSALFYGISSAQLGNVASSLSGVEPLLSRWCSASTSVIVVSDLASKYSSQLAIPSSCVVHIFPSSSLSSAQLQASIVSFLEKQQLGILPDFLFSQALFWLWCCVGLGLVLFFFL